MSALPELLPGAEPYSAAGGPVGVLLCHGFTGCPQSLRPWAEYLGDAGMTVELPRLPGHGTTTVEMSRTTWHDWYATVDRAYDDLKRRCDSVFVMGLSMGGALALRVAQMHPDTVRGIVLVNPSLTALHPALRLLPLLRHVVPAMAGPRGDIQKAGVVEQGYDRMPLHALHSLTQLWRRTSDDLHLVRAPILLFRSEVDHVVEPASASQLRAGIRVPVEERILRNSHHVATLDNDAPEIFEGSLQFVRTRLLELAAAKSAIAPTAGSES